jgi:hypothetical protein
MEKVLYDWDEYERGDDVMMGDLDLGIEEDQLVSVNVKRAS